MFTDIFSSWTLCFITAVMHLSMFNRRTRNAYDDGDDDSRRYLYYHYKLALGRDLRSPRAVLLFYFVIMCSTRIGWYLLCSYLPILAYINFNKCLTVYDDKPFFHFARYVICIVVWLKQWFV